MEEKANDIIKKATIKKTKYTSLAELEEDLINLSISWYTTTDIEDTEA